MLLIINHPPTASPISLLQLFDINLVSILFLYIHYSLVALPFCNSLYLHFPYSFSFFLFFSNIPFASNAAFQPSPSSHTTIYSPSRPPQKSCTGVYNREKGGGWINSSLEATRSKRWKGKQCATLLTATVVFLFLQGNR